MDDIEDKIKSTPGYSVNEGVFAWEIVKVGLPPATTTATPLTVEQVELPESFLAGWADYNAGRVTQMDI